MSLSNHYYKKVTVTATVLQVTRYFLSFSFASLYYTQREI